MKKILIIICCTTIGFCIGYVFVYLGVHSEAKSKDEEVLSYEDYNSKTEMIYKEHFAKNYKNVTVPGLTITSYGGLKDSEWSLSQTNAIDNNMLTPKTIEVLVEEEYFTTRIEMVYEPSIKTRVFTHVNSNVNLEEYVKEEHKVNYQSRTFTSYGMSIEVSSFTNSEEITSLEIAKYQGELVRDLQRYLSENDY